MKIVGWGLDEKTEPDAQSPWRARAFARTSISEPKTAPFKPACTRTVARTHARAVQACTYARPPARTHARARTRARARARTHTHTHTSLRACSLQSVIDRRDPLDFIECYARCLCCVVNATRGCAEGIIATPATWRTPQVGGPVSRRRARPGYRDDAQAAWTGRPAGRCAVLQEPAGDSEVGTRCPPARVDLAPSTTPRYFIARLCLWRRPRRRRQAAQAPARNAEVGDRGPPARLVCRGLAAAQLQSLASVHLARVLPPAHPSPPFIQPSCQHVSIFRLVCAQRRACCPRTPSRRQHSGGSSSGGRQSQGDAPANQPNNAPPLALRPP